MEHPRHVSRSLAAALVLVLALFTIGTARSVGAQERPARLSWTPNPQSRGNRI
jgi:hypothetical protein